MFHTGNTQTELFVSLLKDAQRNAQVALTENEESYAVFMLMRFMRRCEILNTTLALKYLESTLESRAVSAVLLQDAADAGLLFAGLFPERSRRLNVPYTYFANMSRICFLTLADICDTLKHQGEAMLYREVGASTEKLSYVLSCTRMNAANQLPFEIANYYTHTVQ